MHALIADDDRITTMIVKKALESWNIETTVVHDGAAAWERLTSVGGTPPQIVVADWMMPGYDGPTLCRKIRSTPGLASVYVLLLTGRTQRCDLVEGLDAGADDYMTKPVDADELRARIHVGVRVATLQQKLGDQVRELESARDHMARLASTDALTEVYSRRGWFDRAAAELSRCHRYGRPASLLLIDLDYFKRVNDTFGHEAGDRLLQAFAAMLQVECRLSDVIGRVGGEEFAVVLPETELAAAGSLAHRIEGACRAMSVPVAGGRVRCTCSIGISELSLADVTVDDAMRRADAALYDAKRSGRDRHVMAPTDGAIRTDGLPIPAWRGGSTEAAAVRAE